MRRFTASLVSRLDRFIHAPTTELALIVLILFSVILVVLEVALDPDSSYYRILRHVDDWITAIFILELVIRYGVARRKGRFLRQYSLDIIAVQPFLPAFRILRLLRLLRLLRVGILINRTIGRLSSTLAASIGSQLGIFLMVGLVVLVGALGIYQLEGRENSDFESLSDSLWWSFFTLIAGEPISGEPQTNSGRLVALVVMIGGLTMFAVFTGVVSAVMVQRLKTVMEIRLLDLDELRQHILICGWNRSGRLLIEELQADAHLKQAPIVVVAEEIEIPERELRHADQSWLYFYAGDYTTLEVLENSGIYHASRAILLADSTQPRSDQDRDARTVLAALTIEKLNPKIYTCAQLLDRKNNVQLRVAGVEDVVIADEVTGHLIATSTRNLGAVDVLSELLTVQSGNQFYKIPMVEPWVGRSFGQVAHGLKAEQDAILVAIERIPANQSERKIQVNPPHDLKLELTDALVVISRQRPQVPQQTN